MRNTLKKKKLVPAGGDIQDLEGVRSLTRGKCKELEQFVANVKGRIPVFGYPMMCYSPPASGLNPADKRVWRASVLQDGKIIDYVGPQDIKQISENMKKAKSPASFVQEDSSFSRDRKERKNKSPAGAKAYIYEENSKEF